MSNKGKAREYNTGITIANETPHLSNQTTKSQDNMSSHNRPNTTDMADMPDTSQHTQITNTQNTSTLTTKNGSIITQTKDKEHAQQKPPDPPDQISTRSHISTINLESLPNEPSLTINLESLPNDNEDANDSDYEDDELHESELGDSVSEYETEGNSTSENDFASMDDKSASSDELDDILMDIFNQHHPHPSS
ncbi:hypothetical protein K7X08_016958 [Anisodus acutangulus]|uniref:Uncharacterized protein n=1 Tax=Anisodus acutangulus TaxID=402998 RepID=A0A9Q1R6Q9_9SOLA|nr:hypothetical protein K7X08_016958 [Anisodus acutangulus]